jgi:hypothetical protein
MGFFSAIGGAIGTLFGPVGTVIGAGLGGALDGKKTQKTLEKQVAENNRIATIAAQNTNAQMENNSRPVETVTTNEADFDSVIRDAEKAGINPLTALRTAGANSRVTSTTTQVGTTRYVAPLLSSMPSRNFLDVMSDAFTGYKSFEKGRTQKLQLGLETDYLKSQLALNMKNLSDDGFIMEKINLGARFKDPITGTEFIGLNPEAFEMGVSELSGSAAMHASFAGTQVFGTGTANTSQKVKKNLDNLGGYLDNQLQTFKNKYFIKPKASTQLLTNNTSTYGDDVVTYSMKALGLEY